MICEASLLKTQVSEMPTTLNASVTFGGANTTSSTTKAAKPKPRFAEFACNYYEVRKLALRASGSLSKARSIRLSRL